MMNSLRSVFRLVVCVSAMTAPASFGQTTQTPGPQPQQETPPVPGALQRSPAPDPQPVPRISPAPPASSEPGRAGVPGRLQNTIRGLDVGRANLRDVLNSQRPSNDSTARTPALSSFRQKLEAMRRNREADYSAITRRLDRLEVLLSTPPPVFPVPDSTPPTVPPLSPTDRGAQAAASGTPDGRDGSSTGEPKTQLDQPGEIQVPEIPDESDQPDAEPITESAIDRLSLADNLFGSDDIENAARLYIELAADASRMDADDRMWIDYQVACTSRRLKKYDRARKFYRKVVSGKSNGVYPKLAKWWLEAMQRKESYETRNAEIRLELDLK